MSGPAGCRVSPGLAWRVWDGEAVVYVEGRRVTHLLSREATRLFIKLIEGGFAGEGPCGAASGRSPDLGEGSGQAAAQATLLEFVALGIVDRP